MLFLGTRIIEFFFLSDLQEKDSLTRKNVLKRQNIYDTMEMRNTTKHQIYFCSYEVSDGNSPSKGPATNEEQKDVAVEGSVTWSTDNGKQMTLKFTADDEGFKPEGEDIPKS